MSKGSRGFGKGRSPTKFSYTYEDIAILTGTSPAAARKHAQRGHFDPRDLLSVLEYIKYKLQNGQSLQEDKTAELFRKINESKKKY